MCNRPAVSTNEDIAAGDNGLAARLFRQTFNGGGIGLAHFAFVDVTLDRLRHNS